LVGDNPKPVTSLIKGLFLAALPALTRDSLPTEQAQGELANRIRKPVGPETLGQILADFVFGVRGMDERVAFSPARPVA